MRVIFFTIHMRLEPKIEINVFFRGDSRYYLIMITAPRDRPVSKARRISADFALQARYRPSSRSAPGTIAQEVVDPCRS